MVSTCKNGISLCCTTCPPNRTQRQRRPNSRNVKKSWPRSNSDTTLARMTEHPSGFVFISSGLRCFLNMLYALVALLRICITGSSNAYSSHVTEKYKCVKLYTSCDSSKQGLYFWLQAGEEGVCTEHRLPTESTTPICPTHGGCPDVLNQLHSYEL